MFGKDPRSRLLRKCYEEANKQMDEENPKWRKIRYLISERDRIARSMFNRVAHRVM